MLYVCGKDEHCIGFKKREFIIHESIQSRMGKLNQLIKKTGITIYNKSVINAAFFIPAVFQPMADEINSIDIHNLFCMVKIQILGKQPVYKENDRSVLFIIAESYEKGNEYLKKFSQRRPAYVLIIGSRTEIVNVSKNGWFFETKQTDFLETVFNCFMQMPLVIAFRNCVKSIYAGNKVARELAKIASVEPAVNVNVGDEVESGRSIKVNLTLEPEIGSFPELDFKIRNPEIASCDGLNIYGLKEGNSTLEVYKQGSSTPFFTKEFKVVRRNRITRLIFSDYSMLLGVNDKRQIKVDYYPDNADNVKTILWRSSDETIAAVDENGRVVAKSAGNCRIICTAENVSAQCICTVKPYMEDLIIETGTDGKIYLTPMQEIKLSYQCIPHDCIDRRLIMTTSNSDVVNVVNEVLMAKRKGSAEITIRNESGRIIRTLDIVVAKHYGLGKKTRLF